MSREHGFLGRLMVQFATSPLQQMQYEIKELAEWRDLVNNGGPRPSIREARNKFMRAAFINHILVPGMMARSATHSSWPPAFEPDWSATASSAAHDRRHHGTVRAHLLCPAR